MWRQQLIAASIVGDGLEEGSTGFVVQDMCVWGCVATLEAVVEGGVSCDAVCVSLGLKRLH